MREIKFRTFNKATKRWSYWDGKSNPSNEGFCNFCINAILGCHPYIISEQYTGLKDNTKWEQLTEKERETWTKSGKMPSEWKGREIFEGDIIHLWSDFYQKDISRAIIFWNVKNMCFDLKVLHGNYHNWLPRINHNGWFAEIIGNIHENPELLDKREAK
jgi:hypothetical protein